MKKMCGIFKSLLSVFLALIIVVGVFAVFPLTASANTILKEEKSYDIAVVFDNSGSMYNGTTKRWCRAKYAMEIFASMLDYNKDKLSIFPMWPVTTNGSTSESDGKIDRIEIKGKEDFVSISRLYTTVHDGMTPFAPVTEAYNYLRTSTADEKWLLILNDGAFNQNKRGENASLNIQNELSKLASDAIKVQYLGIDLDADTMKLKPDESRNFFVKYTADTKIKEDLIDICNKMFQREELPSTFLTGKKLDLKMSMRNIIVFAQGADAKILSLKNAKGDIIPITLDSGQRKYSTISANGYPNAAVDTTLAGQVVTFGPCSAGEYILEYSGTENIQIFYDPDVAFKATITNEDGNEITADTEDIIPGKYTLTASLVDGKDERIDLTEYNLLGNNITIDALFKSSEMSDFSPCEPDKGSANNSAISRSFVIEFKPELTYEIELNGQYLGKYKISSKDDPSLAWLSEIEIDSSKTVLETEINVTQNWYVLKDHDEWKPIRVVITLEGQPLTDEQLANTKLDIAISDNLSFRCEPINGESAFNVYIAQDKNGQYIEPQTGKYKVKAKATYTDEFGENIESRTDDKTFEIQKYSKLVRILIYLGIILILLALWLMFMLQKVLPKEITKDTASFTTISSGELDATFVEVQYSKKSRSLSISGSPAVDYNEQCNVSFNLRAVDNRFVRSKRRRIAIIGIDSPCDEIKIAGSPYVKYEGQWILKSNLRLAETGRTAPPTDHILSCAPRFELSRSGGLSVLSCKTKTIK